MKKTAEIQLSGNHNFAELNEDLPERQLSTDIWTPYTVSKHEQPLCCTCCCPCYFEYRWKILKPFQNCYLFSNYSLGFCLLFSVVVLITAYLSYLDWGNIMASSSLPNFFLQMCFLLPAKNSVWLFLTGISSENVIFWHKFSAVLCLITGVLHGMNRIILTGEILISLICCMVIFSIEPIRRKCYDVFLKLHWIIFILIIVAGSIHGASPFGAIIWLIDIMLRVYIARKNRKNMQNIEVKPVSDSCVQISFQNPEMKYKPGQYCFFCFPDISIFEWHPFSLYSNTFQNDIRFYIKVSGDWTRKLHRLSQEEQNLDVCMQGPFGNMEICIDNDDEYQVVLLIGGGVGIGPLTSLSNSLIYQKSKGRNLEKIFLVWSTRDQKMLESLIDYTVQTLKKHVPESVLNSGVLESCYYLTGKDQESLLIHNNLIKTGRGRPDLKQYFTKAGDYAREKGKKKVGVFCAGTKELFDQVFEMGKTFSKDGVQFDVCVERNEY